MHALTGLSGLSSIVAAERPFILIDALIAYYKMDEASGQATDSHTNALHLTDTNTVASTTGKVGTSRLFVAGNNEYFTRASSALLQTGDVDFAVAAWVWLDATTGNPPIACKKGVATEWRLFLDSNTGQFKFLFGASTVNAVTFGTVTTGAWNLVMAWHNAAADQLWIQVNNGAPDMSTTGGAVPTANTDPLHVGFDGATSYLSGRIDELFIKKGATFTATDRLAIWNGGVGITY